MPYSRRAFLKANSLAAFAAAAEITIPAAFLQKLVEPVAATPLQSDEPIIDIHQHTNYVGRSDQLLLSHQRAMGITTTILLPAGRPVNTPSTHFGAANGLDAQAGGNESCYRFATAHPGEFRFGACEVPDLPGATKEIEKYLKLGASVIGELKFGVDCDAKPMQKIYQLAQHYNVPVLMHWEFKRYNYGFEKFHKMLMKYRKVNFLGHAQTWWANVDRAHIDQKILYPKTKVTPGGLTDRLLRDYPNMYADLSAGSGLNFFTRDEDHTKQFLKRHQDKLIYGSDCPDLVGVGCQGSSTIAAIRRLSGDKTIERKLLYENAKKLFRL